MIVSRDGYVLTAGHVSGTPGQRMVIVLANGRKLRAKALGANNNIDSGMVKITDAARRAGVSVCAIGDGEGFEGGGVAGGDGASGGISRGSAAGGAAGAGAAGESSDVGDGLSR